jgi:hypothetical protein
LLLDRMFGTPGICVTRLTLVLENLPPKHGVGLHGSVRSAVFHAAMLAGRDASRNGSRELWTAEHQYCSRRGLLYLLDGPRELRHTRTHAHTHTHTHTHKIHSLALVFDGWECNSFQVQPLFIFLPRPTVVEANSAPMLGMGGAQSASVSAGRTALVSSVIGRHECVPRYWQLRWQSALQGPHVHPT